MVHIADRVTTLRLRAEIADLKAKMAEAGLAVESVGDKAKLASERSRAALGALSNTAGLLGIAMVAAAGMAVKAFADFDQSMSNVQAATHESAANMALLRDAALEAGKRTVYSATESAGAIEELAKAGLTTADILGGALNGALDLAAAGALSVTEAAETMSVSLQQFKLPGTDAAHVADLLAAGAGKAMGSVSDLGSAMRQAGLVANSTGLTIEETTAGLSAFAAAGLLGSDAGTSFKAMLQRLTPQSAEAQAKMDELGISAYDAGGNFIGLAEFSGNLQESMKDLSPEARNAAMTVMFGSDAVRAATVLYDQGATGINEWTEKVNDAGYAAETAAIRLDNLKGDLEQLSGSVETAMIGLGEGANGPLRTLTQGVTELVNQFAGLPPGVQGALLAIVGGGGLALLGVAGIGKLTIAVSEAITSFKALSTTAKVTGGIAAGVFAIGTLALMAWATQAAEARARTEELQGTLDDLGNTTDATLSSINAALAKNRDGWLEGIFGADPKSLIDTAEKFGLTVEDLQGAIFGEADAMDRVNAATSEYAGNNSLRTTEVNKFSTAIQGWKDALTEAERAEGQKILADEAAGIGQDDLAGDYDVTTESIAAQIPTLEDLISAQAEAAGVVMSERDAQRAFQAAIDDATLALETNGATLDITTEAGRANQAALDDIAKSGWDVIASMQANGATQAELQAAMQVSRDSFVNMAIAEGMGADEANRLADEMGLIPAKVSPVVTVNIAGAARDVERLKAILRTIPDVVITASMRTQGGYYANRAAGGIVYGPGTSTSDSIPARLSTGEYVVKADSVAHYGPAFFDNLNAMRFASGGYVGGGYVAGSSAPGVSSGDTFVIDGMTFQGSDLSPEVLNFFSDLRRRARQKAGVN